MRTSWKTLRDVSRDQNMMRKIPRKVGQVVKKDPVKQFSSVRYEIQTTDLKQRGKKDWRG